MKRWMWGVVLVVCACRVVVASEIEIPTDFMAKYMSLAALEITLADHGLTILGEHEVAGNTNYTSIVYTSADLKKLGQMPGRGFISVLRILHNAEKQELVVSNPDYFIRAFLQKDYQDGMAAPVLTALEAALGQLTPTADALSAEKLATYKFMIGMPKYDSFERVGKGSTATLLQRLKENEKDHIVFSLDLHGDGSSMLCGIALPDEIEQFNDTLQTMERSHLLPYMVLIENGEANILPAKYYFALSFPRLTMTEFMKIMSVPGKIKEAFAEDFK